MTGGGTRSTSTDGLYAVAKTGASVTVDRWHGRIKRISIGVQTDDQWSTWRFTLAWVIGLDRRDADRRLRAARRRDSSARVRGVVGRVHRAYMVLGRWGPAWYVVPRLVVVGAVVPGRSADFAVAGAGAPLPSPPTADGDTEAARHVEGGTPMTAVSPVRARPPQP